MGDEQEKLVRTAVFDICDTLYYSNTTHDFIRFVMEQEPLTFTKPIYSALNSKFSPLRYLLIAFGVKTGRDVLKKFNVSLLRGKTRQQLATLSKRFVREYLAIRRIQQTHKLVSEKRAEGLRVVLCSSSIEPVVSAIAAELHIDDFLGTSLRYDGEVFTGEISEDLANIKLRVLKDRGLLGLLVYAASDNLSDRELLEAAENASAILHSEKRRSFWEKYNFEIINLNP